MSKIIEFNARDFKFDTSCDGTGDRLFLTTDLGTKEVWEIGDWDWNAARICSEKKLEKNTDYVFRFAISGGYCSTWDSVSRAWVYHTDGFKTENEALDEKMTFPLEKDRFAPVISKKDSSGVIRVFEIPFNTGEFENWKIVLVSQHAVSRFMPEGDSSDYDKLQNMTLKELKNPFQSSGMDKILGAIKDLSGDDNKEQDGNKRSTALSEILDAVKKLDMGGAPGKTFANRTYTETEFFDLLKRIDSADKADFTNIKVDFDNGMEGNVSIGAAAEGAAMNFSGLTLTSLAMSAIIAKTGNGCVLNFNGVIVTDDGIDRMITGGSPNGVVIRIMNTTMPEAVLKFIKTRMSLGENCTLETSGIIFN